MAKKNTKRLRLTSKILSKEHNEDYFLSRNCLTYPDDEIFLNKVVLPKSWENHSTTIKINNKCKKSYDQIFPFLVKSLNKLHNINENKIFWERIIGQWLYLYLINYFEKLDRLDRALKIKPNLVAHSLDFNSFKVFKSRLQFEALLRESEEVHLQQFSLILKYHYPENVEFFPLNWSASRQDEWKLFDKIIFDSLYSSIKHTLKSFFSKIIKKIIPNGLHNGKTVIFLTLLSLKDLLYLMIKSRFKIIPIFEFNIRNKSDNSDFQKRSIFFKYSPDKNISSINQKIIESIKYFIPFEIIEDFRPVYDGALKIVNNHHPQNIVTSRGLYSSIEFSIWSSICSNYGSTIYGYQHGGAYGDIKPTIDERFERKCSDFFLTWGWKDGPDTIPFYASIFKKRKTKIKDKLDGILWVATGDSKFHYLLEELVIGENIYEYLNDQTTLFSMLEKEIQKKINIRIYPKNFGWEFKERWLSNFPNANISSVNMLFSAQLLKSELIIIDHLGGTTTLECFFENKPLIIIANKELFSIRESAMEDHDLLHSVGILHYELNSAAKVLNEINNDIRVWWMNEERQRVVRYFKSKYVSSEDKQMSGWLKLFS